jgi:hypothetical protein
MAVYAFLYVHNTQRHSIQFYGIRMYYVCIYVCMHIYIYICMHVCTYACVCVCVCVCVYVCMYVCIYVYIHTHIEGVGKFFAWKKEEIISRLSKTAQRSL